MYLRRAIFLVRTFEVRAPLQASAVVNRSRWLGNMSICILLAATAMAATKPELSIKPTTIARRGRSVNVSVQFAGQGASVTALQFDLKYNPMIFTVTATPGSVTSGAGKSLGTNNLSNGTTRFLISGLNQNALADGSVVDLTIQVRGRAPIGPKPISIFNVVGATASGQAVSVKAVSGKVLILLGR